LSRAAVLGRPALGGRAGRGPLRIGADPDARWIDRPTSEPTPSCVPVPEQARWSSS
jgi:hypothetical protein